MPTTSASGYIAESPEKLRRIARHFRAHLGLERDESPRCNAPWTSAVIETDGIGPAVLLSPADRQPSSNEFRRGDQRGGRSGISIGAGHPKQFDVQSLCLLAELPVCDALFLAESNPTLALRRCTCAGSPRLPAGGRWRMYSTMDHISSSVSTPLDAGIPEGKSPFSITHFSCPSV